MTAGRLLDVWRRFWAWWYYYERLDADVFMCRDALDRYIDETRPRRLDIGGLLERQKKNGGIDFDLTKLEKKE